jgi:DNA polymerase elongation subunit (family B)
MAAIVFDIETLALPVESFDEVQLEYLLKFAKDDKERAEEIQKFSLYPLTSKIITIGMMNPESGAGKVFFDAPREQSFTSEDGKLQYVAGDEQDILTNFWETLQKYSTIVTFNGRTFDCPFIMIRSMMHGVKAGRNLIPYRYSSKEHFDILDQLTFYGASRKFNLDFYTKAFGIKSPKAEGITGLDLGRLQAEGKYRQIAEYCAGDIRATSELYIKVRDYFV